MCRLVPAQAIRLDNIDVITPIAMEHAKPGNNPCYRHTAQTIFKR